MNAAQFFRLMDRPLADLRLSDLEELRGDLARSRGGYEQRLAAVEARQGALFAEGAGRSDLRGQRAAAVQVAALDAEADGLAALLRITHKQLLLLDRLVWLRESLDALARLHRETPAAVPIDWQALVDATQRLDDEARLDELNAALGATPAQPTPAPASGDRVAQVLDGGTIELTDGRRVRYIGVDAPRLVNALGRPDAGAEAARDANRALVEGQAVRLEADRQDTDADGALWRYVYLGPRFVNAELIHGGAVYYLSRYPNTRCAETLLAAEQDARRHRRGLWRAA